MNNIKENIIGTIAVVALLIGCWALGSVPHKAASSPLAGAIGGAAGSGQLSPVLGYFFPNVTNGDYNRFQALEADGQFLLGGFSTTSSNTAIGLIPSTGSCVTTSTSTIFAVLNPTAATSTATITLFGTGSATTSDILVGTSTTPAPAGLTVATSSVDASLIGLFKVASSSQFYATNGVTRTIGGFLAASSGTYPTSLAKVVVGPFEYIIGFATSTYVHAGADGATGSGLMATPTACTYKILWQF